MYPSLNGNSLQIEGYNLVWADYSKGVKRGGVWIYYRESLPVRVISIIYLKEVKLHSLVLLELVQNNNSKKTFISVVYHSPSQTNDEFNQFQLNFEEMLLDVNQWKPYLTLVRGILMWGLLLGGLMKLTPQKDKIAFINIL